MVTPKYTLNTLCRLILSAVFLFYMYFVTITKCPNMLTLKRVSLAMSNDVHQQTQKHKNNAKVKTLTNISHIE